MAPQQPHHQARHAARNANTCRAGARLVAAPRPSVKSWPRRRAIRPEKLVAGPVRHGDKMPARRRPRSPRSAARCFACDEAPAEDVRRRETRPNRHARGRVSDPAAPLASRSRRAAPDARLVCPPRPSLRCRVRSDAMLLSVRSRPPGTEVCVVMPGSYVTASGAQLRAQTNRY